MKMRKTKYRLCLMYDPETEKHFTDEAFRGVNGLVLPKVPECPERTQSIMRKELQQRSSKVLKNCSLKSLL